MFTTAYTTAFRELICTHARARTHTHTTTSAQVDRMLRKHGVVVDEAAARKKARLAQERSALVGFKFEIETDYL